MADPNGDVATGSIAIEICVPISDRKSSSSSSEASPQRKGSMFDMPNLRNHAVAQGVAPKGIVTGSNTNAIQTAREVLVGNLFALGLVLSYIGVSILYYHNIEGWTVVDCIYYAMVIVTTVGYGDVYPVKPEGKAFTIFFAFYGICTIGMALGQLASWFLGRQKAMAKETTQRLLQTVDTAAETTMSRDPAHEKAHHHHHLHLSLRSKRWPKWVRTIFSDSNKAIASALLPILVSIGGGLIVGAIEGWAFLDCIYYSIITITTIGFGDFSPKSQTARLYAIFFLPLSVVSVAHGIGSIIEELGRRKVMKSKISMKELLAMDSDGDGKVSQMEYLCYMLVKLGKAEEDDIQGILAQFRKLDKDGSGELDKDDLERLDRQLQKQHEEQHEN